MILTTYQEEDNVRVSQWTADTFDQILIEGDALYLKGLENQTIPDTKGIVTDLFTRSSTFHGADPAYKSDRVTGSWATPKKGRCPKCFIISPPPPPSLSQIHFEVSLINVI